MLIDGEVTSIEAICENLVIYTVVRGYEKAHRLQRARRSRTFVDMTDSDIAQEVAGDIKLEIGTVDDTNTAHNHIAQVAQTDWEFLKQRARENGFETGVTQGQVLLPAPAGNAEGGPAAAWWAPRWTPGVDAAGVADRHAARRPSSSSKTSSSSIRGSRPRTSRPRSRCGCGIPKAAEVVVGKSASKTVTADAGRQAGRPRRASSARAFSGCRFRFRSRRSACVRRQPEQQGVRRRDRPSGWGSTTSDSVDEMAVGVAEHIASTFAEAEGLAVGNPKIAAGEKIEIEGVPKAFKGTWIVTNARHIFDDEHGGYHTRFFVSGRQERSLARDGVERRARRRRARRFRVS